MRLTPPAAAVALAATLGALAAGAAGCGEDEPGSRAERVAPTESTSTTPTEPDATTPTSTTPTATTPLPPTRTSTDPAPRPAPPPPQGRTGVIARGDGICRRYNVQLQRFNERAARAARGASSEREALRATAPILGRGLAAQRRGTAELAALRPPRADRKQYAEIIGLARRRDAIAKRAVAAAGRGDVKAFSRLDEERDDLRFRLRIELNRYGFRVCGDTPAER